MSFNSLPIKILISKRWHPRSDCSLPTTVTWLNWKRTPTTRTPLNTILTSSSIPPTCATTMPHKSCLNWNAPAKTWTFWPLNSTLFMMPRTPPRETPKSIPATPAPRPIGSWPRAAFPMPTANSMNGSPIWATPTSPLKPTFWPSTTLSARTNILCGISLNHSREIHSFSTGQLVRRWPNLAPRVSVMSNAASGLANSCK
mmetsp:Transcript_9907/g.16577  ORF Transcript_9907/g.16577 Transcript_9907/m.16577 type:complete len:200 (+) Transcript_9907:248-847(+)